MKTAKFRVGVDSTITVSKELEPLLPETCSCGITRALSNEEKRILLEKEGTELGKFLRSNLCHYARESLKREILS